VAVSQNKNGRNTAYIGGPLTPALRLYTDENHPSASEFAGGKRNKKGWKKTTRTIGGHRTDPLLPLSLRTRAAIDAGTPSENIRGDRESHLVEMRQNMLHLLGNGGGIHRNFPAGKFALRRVPEKSKDLGKKREDGC